MIIPCIPVHPLAKLPSKAFPSDAAFDVFCVEDVSVGMRSTVVRLGLNMAVPEGHYAKLEGRSGLARDFGLKVDGIINIETGEVILGGILDCHFRGEPAALLSTLPGMGNKHFKAGDKVCQLTLHEVIEATFDWAPDGKLSETDRGSGGFGHTDTRLFEDNGEIKTGPMIYRFPENTVIPGSYMRRYELVRKGLSEGLTESEAEELVGIDRRYNAMLYRLPEDFLQPRDIPPGLVVPSGIKVESEGPETEPKAPGKYSGQIYGWAHRSADRFWSDYLRLNYAEPTSEKVLVQALTEIICDEYGKTKALIGKLDALQPRPKEAETPEILANIPPSVYTYGMNANDIQEALDLYVGNTSANRERLKLYFEGKLTTKQLLDSYESLETYEKAPQSPAEGPESSGPVDSSVETVKPSGGKPEVFEAPYYPPFTP